MSTTPLTRYTPTWCRVLVSAALLCALLLAACSSDGSGNRSSLAGERSFGANEGQCASAVLANEDNDQQLMTAGAECFVSQVEEDIPVTWDLSRPTAEGDPIFYRYIFDGTDIWILEDSRADEFGSGATSSLRCEGIERTAWEPVGVGCVGDDSLGFDGFSDAD